jgi:hypothetical protein
MITIVYVVTYRMDNKSPQQELERYTKEAAVHFATGIQDAGGVAIITEDVKDIQENEMNEHPKRSLQW